MTWNQIKISGKWLLVSSFGNVVDIETDRPLHLFDRNGYLYFRTTWARWPHRRSVHSIVARLFLGPPPSPSHVAHHINHIKKDNRVENLMWVTPPENLQYYTEFKKDNPELDSLLRIENKKRRLFLRRLSLLKKQFNDPVISVDGELFFPYPPFKWTCKPSSDRTAKEIALKKIGITLDDYGLYNTSKVL